MKEELHNLDILDASFPCSVFSIAGDRQKAWGKEKVFREGQKAQRLDDLAFYSIDLAKELKPKVVVFENVQGLLQGEAIEYVKEIYKQMDNAGYILQHWLLNARNMGVPQNRPRVFFLGLRKDLCKPFMVQKDLFERVPKIDMDFNEKEIVLDEFSDYNGRQIPKGMMKYWEYRNEKDNSIGDISSGWIIVFLCSIICFLKRIRYAILYQQWKIDLCILIIQAICRRMIRF